MNRPVAAIWARVSGAGQQSLPSQVTEVKEWLESLGYQVLPQRILMTDWTSTDILRCSEMRVLLGWVANKEVSAVGSLHLDRFAARPGQVAQILDAFRQSGVELLLKQTPLPTGLIGEIMGLVLTIAKAVQVERADQGAKRGLHDRPKLKRVPVVYRPLYGYTWEARPKRLASGETIRLLPDINWDIARFICREALAGTTSRKIVRRLVDSHIPSPAGKPEWCIQSIVGILKNPVYGGRFYALRRENVEPRNRVGDTYGKSSSRTLPFDEWQHLPEVEVVNPPLTWEEWLTVQRRLEYNRLLAQRNAKHDYLLRGLIICDTHRRRMKGWPLHKTWQYICPVGQGCRRWLPGPAMEERAKEIVRLLLNDPDAVAGLASTEDAKAAIGRELKSLETKHQRAVNALVELERRRLDDCLDRIDRLDDEVYRRLKLQYEVQINWATERAAELNRQLASLEYQAELRSSLTEMREELSAKLSSFGTTEWRRLFTDLRMTLHVGEDNSVVAHIDLPYQQVVHKTADIVSTSPSGARW